MEHYIEGTTYYSVVPFKSSPDAPWEGGRPLLSWFFTDIRDDVGTARVTRAAAANGGTDESCAWAWLFQHLPR